MAECRLSRQEASLPEEDGPIPQEKLPAQDTWVQEAGSQLTSSSEESKVDEGPIEGVTHFISAMELVRPDVLRGIPVSRILTLLPWYWWRGLPQGLSMYPFTAAVQDIDEFFSHCWKAPLWLKYVNILLLYHAAPAFFVATALATIAFVISGFGVLPPLGNSHPWTWSTWSGVGGFYLALLLCRRRTMAFLDIACVHQDDAQLKFDAVVSLGGILRRSKSMLVFWDPAYVWRPI